MIFFGMAWFDLLGVQGTLKSLLQHHSSKVSILQCSAFFMVQLSHPYRTARKTMALTRWTFIGKVMPLLFNTLSRFVIAFIPRSKCLKFLTAVTIRSDLVLNNCFQLKNIQEIQRNSLFFLLKFLVGGKLWNWSTVTWNGLPSLVFIHSFQ